MDEKIREIKKDIGPHSYLNSFKAIEYIRYLISENKKLEERIELAETTRDDALAYAKMHKEKVKKLEERIEKVIDWSTSPEGQKYIKDIPDHIWIPFTKLVEGKR